MYSTTLKYFMTYLRLAPDAYDKLLDKEPKIIQMDFCLLSYPMLSYIGEHQGMVNAIEKLDR